MASYELIGNRKKLIAIIESSGNKKSDKANKTEMRKQDKNYHRCTVIIEN